MSPELGILELRGGVGSSHVLRLSNCTCERSDTGIRIVDVDPKLGRAYDFSLQRNYQANLEQLCALVNASESGLYQSIAQKQRPASPPYLFSYERTWAAD